MTVAPKTLMGRITRLFHGTLVVPDVLLAAKWYHDFFGSWVYEATHLSAEDCYNSANLIGGTFSMEVLAPVSPSVETPSARFLRRHGPHFLNIAFWVDDARSMVQGFLEKGVRVALPGGNQVAKVPEEDFRFFVPHPKDTFGTLFEFIQEDPDFQDPRRQSWWSSSYWSDQHPLGIEGLSHCTSLVEDALGAERFYKETLGCEMVLEEEDVSRGTRSMFFALGDILLELATPVSGESELARYLEVHGPVLHGFTFKVRDLAKANAHIQGFGLIGRERAEGTVEIGPEDTFGGRYGFTQRVIPGHPKLSKPN